MTKIINTKKDIKLLIAGIGIYLLTKFGRYLSGIVNDIFYSSEIEYFKVMLPRKYNTSDASVISPITKTRQFLKIIHKLGRYNLKDLILKIIFNKPKIILLLEYKNGEISFMIGTYAEYRKNIENALNLQFEDIVIENINRLNFEEQKYLEIKPVELSSDYQADTDYLNNILTALSKIPPHDRFVIMYIIKPQIRAYQYQTGIMLISASDNLARANNNLENISIVFEGSDSLMTDILLPIIKPCWLISYNNYINNFFYKSNILSNNTLSTLFYLPDSQYNNSPIIKWSDYKIISAPDNLPIGKVENGYLINGNKCYQDQILLGMNVHNNVDTSVYIQKEDRMRHQYIIGKSGTGKSYYLSLLARQDIWNGNSICIIDPHGDLVDEILKYIPTDRLDDLIYFDASDEAYPMGLNLYDIDNIQEAERIVYCTTEILLNMFGNEKFDTRMQEFFKYGSLTLLEDLESGATLLDIPRLFTDKTFRNIKIQKINNPEIKNFWDKTYNTMSTKEKDQFVADFASKFISFNTNKLIRNIIGQTKSTINFRSAMDTNKIILINLAKGKIGASNSNLLGKMIISKIYNAALSRANIPQSERKDFFLYIDEFQSYLSDTLVDMLSEARKYRLSLIIAHQYLAQLDEKNKNAIFGNIATISTFKVGLEDAEYLEQELAPRLSSHDLVYIPYYQAYLKLNINNSISKPFNINIKYSQDHQNNQNIETIKDNNIKKNYKTKELVETEILSQNNNVYHNLGYYYHKQYKYAEAEAMYKEVLNYDQNNIQAYLNLGDVYKDQHDYTNAELMCQKIIEINPDYTDAYNNLGILYDDQGKYAEAEAMYQKALEIDPNYTNAYYNLGIVYGKQERYADSEIMYKKAIHLNPLYTNAYYNLAILYSHQKKHKVAELMYKKTLEINPLYTDAYNNLGVYYKEQQNYEQAEIMYKKTIEINHHYILGYHNLGNLYKDQKKYAEAENMYKQLLKYNPNEIDGYYNLGVIYYYQQKYDDAEMMYQKAIKTNLNYTNAYYSLGLVYSIQQKYDDAEYMYKKVLELNPNYYYAYTNIGNIKLIKGNYNEAKEYLMHAIQLEPENYYCYTYCGELYLKWGNSLQDQKLQVEYYQQAIQYYETSLQKGNTDKIIYENLVILYEKIGNKGKANEYKNFF